MSLCCRSISQVHAAQLIEGEIIDEIEGVYASCAKALYQKWNGGGDLAMAFTNDSSRKDSFVRGIMSHDFVLLRIVYIPLQP
jgi:hypothetical protein